MRKLFSILSIVTLCLCVGCSPEQPEPSISDVFTEKTITYQDEPCAPSEIPACPFAPGSDQSVFFAEVVKEMTSPDPSLVFTDLPVRFENNELIIDDVVKDYAALLQQDDQWNSYFTPKDFNALCYLLEKKGTLGVKISETELYQIVIPASDGRLKMGRSPVKEIISRLNENRIDGNAVVTRTRYKNKNYISGSPANTIEVLSELGSSCEYNNSLNYVRTTNNNAIAPNDAMIAALVQNSTIPTDFDPANLDVSSTIFFSGCIFDAAFYMEPLTVFYQGFWEQVNEEPVGAAIYATCADETYDSNVEDPNVNALNTYMVQPYVWDSYNLFIWVNNLE